MGFSLEAPLARPLLARYLGGEATRRYYQDAAIRAVLERIAQVSSSTSSSLPGLKSQLHKLDALMGVLMRRAFTGEL